VAIGDIDYTGARAISQILDELDHSHVALAVARAAPGARQHLTRTNLLDRIGRDHFFPSVDEAVVTLGPGPTGPGPTSPGPTGPGS
jgi:MFS superfamily sulfate permease-like transporter